MRIAILGTTGLKNKMLEYKHNLELNSTYEVKLPAFDSHPEFDELQICEYNRAIIEWADRIDVFWDARSIGFTFDFGMIFMARKPVKIIYLEKKTLAGVLTKDERGFDGQLNRAPKV